MKVYKGSWVYRGHSIGRSFPSGMYETYIAGRFWRADTLAGIKARIRQLEALRDDPFRDVMLAESRAA